MVNDFIFHFICLIVWKLHEKVLQVSQCGTTAVPRTGILQSWETERGQKSAFKGRCLSCFISYVNLITSMVELKCVRRSFKSPNECHSNQIIKKSLKFVNFQLNFYVLICCILGYRPPSILLYDVPVESKRKSTQVMAISWAICSRNLEDGG